MRIKMTYQNQSTESNTLDIVSTTIAYATFLSAQNDRKITEKEIEIQVLTNPISASVTKLGGTNEETTVE